MRASWKVVSPVLLLAAVVALYAPSLHVPVFFDDIYFFNSSRLNIIFLNGFAFEIRWLPYFLTAWVDLIFDDTIFAQRIFNVGLHLATGFMLYTLVKQVSNHAAPHRNNERAAIAAALLFLLHPIAVYAVGYLIQRTILMATLFGLLALNTYFDGLITRKKAYFVFSAFFYLLSAFSKEHAVLIPFVALALTPLAAPLTRQNWRQLVLPFALYLPIVVLVVFKSQSNLGRAYEPFAEQFVRLHGNEGPLMLWMLSVMTQATLFFKYLWLTLMPYQGWMSIDMRESFSVTLWDPKYWLGMLALTAYALAALSLLLRGGRRGLAGFALLAPLLLFAVEFSTVRIQEPFVLYRAYLWIPFLFMLIPALSYKLSTRIFWTILLIVAIAYAFSSNNRLASFSSSYALWDDAVRKLPDEFAPGAARPFNNRGFQNMKRGDLAGAITDFGRAVQANPEQMPAYLNRALVYVKQGKFQDALNDVEQLIALDPTRPEFFNLRGAIYQSSGQVEKAMLDFEYACKHKSLSACVAIERAKASYPTSDSGHS